jgi:hypothetical protein
MGTCAREDSREEVEGGAVHRTCAQKRGQAEYRMLGKLWSRERDLGTCPHASHPQEEQHRSHENCLDAASDDLLDLQRNLPERRGRSRELEEYRLRKEHLEYEVRPGGLTASRASRPTTAALSWLPLFLQPLPLHQRLICVCTGGHLRLLSPVHVVVACLETLT